MLHLETLDRSEIDIGVGMLGLRDHRAEVIDEFIISINSLAFTTGHHLDIVGYQDGGSASG